MDVSATKKSLDVKNWLFATAKTNVYLLHLANMFLLAGNLQTVFIYTSLIH